MFFMQKMILMSDFPLHNCVHTLYDVKMSYVVHKLKMMIFNIEIHAW